MATRQIKMPRKDGSENEIDEGSLTATRRRSCGLRSLERYRGRSDLNF